MELINKRKKKVYIHEVKSLCSQVRTQDLAPQKNVMRQGRDTKAIKPKGASFKSNHTEMVFSQKKNTSR